MCPPQPLSALKTHESEANARWGRRGGERSDAWMARESRGWMAEDQGARRDVPVRVGFVHPSLRQPQRLPRLPMAEATADGGPRPNPPRTPPNARRGWGFGGGCRHRRIGRPFDAEQVAWAFLRILCPRNRLVPIWTAPLSFYWVLLCDILEFRVLAA